MPTPGDLPPVRVLMDIAEGMEPLPSGIVDEVNNNDGTVPICGPAGSMPLPHRNPQRPSYTPMRIIQGFGGKYGFYDSYNLDQPEPWFSQEYIGINKGITLLMIENYFSGLVWDLYMKNQYVRDGLKNLMFSEITKGMGQPDCSINSSLKTA